MNQPATIIEHEARAAKPPRAVAKRQSAEVSREPVAETAAIISMIDRAARDPAVDIEKMKQLLAMRAEIEAKAAEREFNAAMSVAQKEMGRIATDANNKQTSSRYATYAAIDRVIRPIYTKHGFALSFDTEEGGPADHIRVVCFVTNGDHTRKYKADMPADGKGAKGGDVMTKTHATGAAMQYGQRYLVKGIFNLAIGQDDDGNTASVGAEKITEKQVTELIDLLEAKGAPRDKFLRWAKVERFEDIPAAHFASCLGAANNYKG